MPSFQWSISISMFLISATISDAQSTTKNIPNTDHPTDFENLTKTSTCFVDKTPLLETLFSDSPHDHRIISITTPRGFGRTTNLDMIRRFASIETDSQGTRRNKFISSAYHIFGPQANLSISRNDLLIQDHLGMYPVIYLDLSNVTAPSIRETMQNLHERIKQSYQRCEWLENKKLRMSQNTIGILEHSKHKSDWKFISKMMKNLVNVVDIQNSISKLIQMLVEQFQHKAILLIDNYDAPLMDAVYHQSNNSVGRFYEFFNAFFSSTLDDSVNDTELVILTGRHPVSIKTQTEIDFYSFLSDHDLSQFFGFNEAQVQHLLDLNPGSVSIQELRNNFGGYLINGSSTPLYNPSSVYEYFHSIRAQNQTEISSTPLYDPQIHKLVKRFMSNVTWQQDKGIEGYWGDRSFEIIPRFDVDQLERIASVINGSESITGSDLDMYFSILFVNGYFTHPNDTAPDVIAFPNLQMMTTFQQYLN
ncbi:uncharacterized protein LOC135847448 [Planococcus citri]|uniref:uncharacterized protein LOC135847448 n=1 Tax=Planococcus citri TaxID=170843 RepID=UPI0031F8C80A